MITNKSNEISSIFNIPFSAWHAHSQVSISLTIGKKILLGMYYAFILTALNLIDSQLAVQTYICS